MHELPLDKKNLNELIKKARHFNIFPIDLPRYFRSETGHPIAEPLSELVDEGEGYLRTASKSEIESLLDCLNPGIRMMMGRTEDLRRIALYYVVAELQKSYFSFKGIVKQNIRESEVLKIYPELENRIDKDGLLQLDDQFTLHDGGIEYRGHILHYHQFLRRNYTSNPNFDFLGRLSVYRNKIRGNNTFRVAIDHRRIMPKDFYERIFEFDTWYGPPFDREKLDDPNAVGVTVIKRNKNSLFDLTNKLDRTEFFWSYNEGIKTLEIEEVSDISYTFDSYFFNRYIHSEREVQNEITRHIDGAVKVYLNANYSDRFHGQMPKEAKCYKKIKLWRIDGDIDLENWISLISFFFKSNEMIIEYFNPRAFEEMFELRVRDFQKWRSQQSENEKGT